jgi:putative salt-induced outer membrane protein
MRKLPAALAATTVCTLAPLAFGQTANSLMATKPVAPTTTEVATSGFDKTDVAAAAATKNVTEMQLSAGGITSSGNSKMLAVTGAGRFKARRDDNQLSLNLAGNYAEAAPNPDEDRETSLQNIQGKVRYDRFFGKGFAGFLSLSGRNDRFQGLILRTNIDPGLAYYFIDKEKQQFWTELGYDAQFDLRREEALNKAAEEGILLDKTQTRHSTRLFLGYNGSINSLVGITTGVEYLQGLPDTEFWRLNWDLGLTAALSSKFSLSTTFNLRYDHKPLPTVRNTDTITAVNLVYQLL